MSASLPPARTIVQLAAFVQLPPVAGPHHVHVATPAAKQGTATESATPVPRKAFVNLVRRMVCLLVWFYFARSMLADALPSNGQRPGMKSFFQSVLSPL